jgi:hypothetical protein
VVIGHDNVVGLLIPEAGKAKIADAHARVRRLAAISSGSSRGGTCGAFAKAAGIINLEDEMQKPAGPKKQKCKNCEGKGTLKKGNKVVRCQRCNGTGIKQR